MACAGRVCAETQAAMPGSFLLFNAGQDGNARPAGRHVNFCGGAYTVLGSGPIDWTVGYTGATALLDELPTAQWMLADRGYDADWFREALQTKGHKATQAGLKIRSTTIRCDKRRYGRRNRIEIMFGRLKDWRRIATRHDRSPMVFFSAIALAATVFFWV